MLSTFRHVGYNSFKDFLTKILYRNSTKPDCRTYRPINIVSLNDNGYSNMQLLNLWNLKRMQYKQPNIPGNSTAYMFNREGKMRMVSRGKGWNPTHRFFSLNLGMTCDSSLSDKPPNPIEVDIAPKFCARGSRECRAECRDDRTIQWDRTTRCQDLNWTL